MNRTELHDEVFRRFVRHPYGILLDYADENGNTVIPTKEECEKCIPSALSWGTPIENGAFFNGLYLLSLLEEAKGNPSEKLIKDIKLIYHGLCVLQDCAVCPGFIARGVADDGVSHYPLSSEDQVLPWLLAMNAYRNSEICEDKEDVKKRLLLVLNRMKNAGWRITHDSQWQEYGFGYMGKGRSYRGIIAYLYDLYLMYELTGDAADLAFYRTELTGKPEGSIYTRKEVVEQSMGPDLVRTPAIIQMWIHLSFQYAAGELSLWDKENTQLYRGSMKRNGEIALRFSEDIGAYDNEKGRFDMDWHGMSDYCYEPFNGEFRPCQQMSLKQISYWSRELVPHRKMEHSVLGNALFGTWIALICGDEKVSAKASEVLNDMLPVVKFDTLRNCYSFVAEACLIYKKQ